MNGGPGAGFIAASVLMAGLVPAADGDTPFLMGLGDLPGGPFASRSWDISLDGSSVVGWSYSDDWVDPEGPVGFEAFRWTEESGMVGLGGLPTRPDSSALGVSGNGATVVGWARFGNERIRAFRWSSSQGMVDLGALADDPEAESLARAASADGSVIVGSSQSPNGNREAFRWSESTGMVGLGDIPGGPFYSWAEGVSADGSVVVGYGAAGTPGGSYTHNEAFRWTASEGFVPLGGLPGGLPGSIATDVSPDGSTIVGRAYSADGPEGGEGFRWTEDEGMVSLGPYPGGCYSIEPWAVSGDGSVIVGKVVLEDSSVVRSFIWDAENGIRDLEDVLMYDYGIDVHSDWLYVSGGAYGITADGLTITGWGTNKDVHGEAWIAHVPETTTVVLLALGTLPMLRRCR